MKCQNCGTEIQEQAKFCPKCGSKLEQPPVVKVPANGSFSHDISKIWPEWQIQKQLGRGSYGVVYQAIRRDNNVESHAAIKIISIPSDSSEVDSLRSEGLDMDRTRTYFKGIVDDFVNEIRLMESLKGIQNIVSVEDYKVVEKTDTIGWDIYIRMELLTPFNTYICDKTLTEREIIKLGADICTALEICGQRNIIHRDIKPENIFVNDFGYFKLGDFGIARKLENMTGGLSQKGTYNYMAPEVANSNEYDARVDTYSLGIVLYRLLNNNKLPFLDTDKQLLNPNERKLAVERRIRGEALPAPCNASPSMANLILRACAHNPNARFASATEMKQALVSVANGAYKIVETDPDRTTAGSSVVRNYEATTVVKNATETSEQRSQPSVSTFGDTKKKKMSKGKKAKIIIMSLLSCIVALAIALAGMFFSSAAFGVYRDMNSDDFDDALTIYRLDVEDSFIQEMLLNMLLKNRASEVTNKYKNGEIDYNTAIVELNTLDEMKFDGAKNNRTEIMVSYADKTVLQYENGDITYDDALTTLQAIKADGYTGADSLIEKITVSNNAINALEKADKYYENGDYENAISEYSKVPESYENYEEAQNKLNQVYADYISSTVGTATKYNSSKNYKQAVQVINTAYDILPDSIDTTELDTVKEESLTAYKTEVANEVAELTENKKWAEAFDVIDEAISFDDNEYFQNLKMSTENKFVSDAVNQADSLMSERNYTSAKTTVNEAIKILPNNSTLKDKLAEIEKKAPVSLATITPINGGWNWNEGTPMDSFGVSYTNMCNYAIFAGGDFFYGSHEVEHTAEYRIQGKYKTITGTLLPHSNIPEDGFGRLQIYADDKLVYTSETIYRKTDMINFIAPVDGADYIKMVILASNGSVWSYSVVDSLLMMDVQLWTE